jgi:DNA modification methylase
MTFWRIMNGDALSVLKAMDSDSVDCCVTSPPYWQLRDYETDGQIGDEDTVEAYILNLIDVFSEIRRVLRQTGTVWVNMGDGYVGDSWGGSIPSYWGNNTKTHDARLASRRRPSNVIGLKRKNMIGMPWRIAFAMQGSGWILRQDIIWHKPNPMPESVMDRCTKSHEYVFVFSKHQKYYFNADVLKEPVSGTAHKRGNGVNRKARLDAERDFNRKRSVCKEPRQNPSFSASVSELVPYRNARSVWTIPTQGRSDHHFASFPDELARRCILAGCPRGGVVLDPFVGRGTTAIVALRHQRSAIGIDINKTYCEMSRRNIVSDSPLFNPSLEEVS